MTTIRIPPPFDECTFNKEVANVDHNTLQCQPYLLNAYSRSNMGRSREFDTDMVLEGALRTFWQQGYEGTPMQDLCSAMALNPGSIYAAFGSKRGLFVETLKRYAETVSAEAMRRINSAPSGLAGIRSYFSHLIDAMVDGDRRFGCLITNSLIEFARNDPELAGMFDLHLARLETTFAAALARARAEGEIRPDAGPDVARFLVTLVQGMNVLAKTRPDRKTLESVVDTALAGLVAVGIRSDTHVHAKKPEKNHSSQKSTRKRKNEN